jgi:hypothetical protein
MRKPAKFWSVLLLFVMASSFAMAVEKTAAQETEETVQFEIGAQDVITASDAGGGYLSTRDILLVAIIILAIIGLAAIL